MLEYVAVYFTILCALTRAYCFYIQAYAFLVVIVMFLFEFQQCILTFIMLTT